MRRKTDLNQGSGTPDSSSPEPWEQPRTAGSKTDLKLKTFKFLKHLLHPPPSSCSDKNVSPCKTLQVPKQWFPKAVDSPAWKVQGAAVLIKPAAI